MAESGGGESNEALFLQQNAADTLLRNTSTLQVLLNMGFPRHRALKALIATGSAGVQVACDWIFAHVKDPTLDDHVPREFILYACPTGPMGDELEKFWHDSLVGIGRNGVHNSFPHVTLCGFFKCKDENVHIMIKALQNVLKKSETDLQNIGLEFFSSGNYVGLFLEESGADYLRKLSQDFANTAASTADTQIEPHSNKQLHITLAYKFIPNQFQGLEALAKKIDLRKPCRWEIRLYSKETRFSNSETLRVLYPFSPRTETHLQLINGDCIFVNADMQMSNKSMDGYTYGTSWMTGCSGLCPATHVERTADTETWTLHKVLPILHQRQSSAGKGIHRRYSRGADEFHSIGYSSADALLQKQIPTVPEATSTDFVNPGDTTVISNTFTPVPANVTSVSPVPSGRTALKVDQQQQQPSCSPVLPPRRPVVVSHAAQSSTVVDTPSLQPKEDVYAKVSKPKGQISIVPEDIQTERRIYIFRHAERVDITFGKGWIQLSFDEKGNYHRRNINMPQKIPKRPGGPKDFTRDSPLTEMGLHQAFLTGQAMRNIGASVHHVYASPSLRCVETANSILKGMELQSKVPVRIDLGLFEWMKWSQGGLPKFLDKKCLKEYGVNVDFTYTQKFQPEDLKQDEKCSEYFHRSNNLVTKILKETTGDILICGHAGSLDGISRELQGLSPRGMTDFVGIVTKVPYCGSIVLEEIPSAGIWQLIDPPYPTLTHAPNPRFDWRMLVN